MLGRVARNRRGPKSAQEPRDTRLTPAPAAHAGRESRGFRISLIKTLISTRHNKFPADKFNLRRARGPGDWGGRGGRKMRKQKLIKRARSSRAGMCEPRTSPGSILRPERCGIIALGFVFARTQSSRARSSSSPGFPVIAVAVALVFVCLGLRSVDNLHEA